MQQSELSGAIERYFREALEASEFPFVRFWAAEAVFGDDFDCPPGACDVLGDPNIAKSATANSPL
jgi:hypothetical protein